MQFNNPFMRWGVGSGSGPSYEALFTIPSLPSELTFTRASSATYFDANGVLQTATDNTPRFDHTFNGTSWEPAGLLMEGIRTNNFLRSFEFENAYWAKTRTTVGAGRFDSPLGASTARLVEINDIALGDKRISRNSIALLPTTNQCSSFVVKKQNLRYCAVTIGEGSNITHSVRAGFDLDTGTVTTTSVNGSGVLAGSGVINLGNGWYRIWVSGAPRTSGTTCSSWLILRETSGDTIEDFTGTLGDGIYVAQGQLETGNFPSSMIETTGSAATRAVDVAYATDMPALGITGQAGTMIAEFRYSGILPIGTAQLVCSFTADSGNDRNALGITSSDVFQAAYTTGGVAQSGLTINTAGNTVAGTVYRAGESYETDNFDAFMAPSDRTVQVDNSGTTFTPTRFQIGGRDGATLPMFGHVRKIEIYPTALPQAELIARVEQ